ncbi:MAG: Ribosomal protein L13 [Candidatus Alkanophagales archaeon MCA70_species_1]|nr:Ribosomal protein L13 [Candidatus Alkanophaga volatiphilum]
MSKDGEEKVIDAEGLILGRLASIVAKRLLSGERITIVNAEKAVISGSREMVFETYKRKRDRGSKEKGPYFPKMPDRILRRTIRGMLPYKQAKGREAFSRLRVYIGVPEEYVNKDKEKIKEASMERLKHLKFVTLGEVAEHLGWAPRARTGTGTGIRTPKTEG